MKVAGKQGLDSSKAKSEEILKEANSKAETILRQADLDGKQAAYEYEVQAEKKNKEKVNQLQQNENKLLRREDALNFREENLSQKEKKIGEKEQAADDKLANLNKLEEDLQQRIDNQIHVLEEVAHLSQDDAKKELMEAVEKKSEKEIAQYLHGQRVYI